MVGQAKIPFSMENLTSSNKLESIDRSQVVAALVARGKDVIGNQNGRDIGLQIYGSFLQCGSRKLIDYRIGIFNGSGINAGDKNEAKDFVGRLLFHPVKDLDIGGSYLNGFANTGSGAGTNQVRNRFGVELSYKWNQFNLKGEYISGEDNKTTHTGWYAQAGCFVIPAKLQLLAKYDTYDPDADTKENISTQYSIILNYNINSWTRLQASYSFREVEGKAVNNNLGSMQFQIGF